MSSAGLVSIVPVGEESVIFSPPPSLENSQESILIYVAMSGSMVPMQVLKSDSIESVKLRIQSCKGIFTRKQKLVCGGRELARGKSLVQDYGVRDGNVVHLVRLADLQVINVKTCCGKEFTFHVEGSRDVGYIKHQIAKKRNLERFDDEEILLNGEPVMDQRLINDLSKNNSDAVIHLFVRRSVKIRAAPIGKNFELSITAPQQNNVKECDVDRENGHGADSESGHNLYVPRKPSRRKTLLEPVIVNPKIELPKEICDLIKSTLDGLDSGNYPIRSSEGTGGAYFMLDASGGKYLSVFKPVDEEPMAVNNPRGLPLSEDGEGLKRGTTVGEGGIRECAVYILDHPKTGHRSFTGELRGFAGVPPTVYVRCLHEGFNHPGGVSVKTGSLQMFMENSGSCEDMGPGAFPVKEVHKIAVLDMSSKIVPLSGFIGRKLASILLLTIEYIRSLDAEEDIALLRFYGWDLPLECARVLRISTMLLKKGVEKGLTPFAIGNMMCRENVRKESVIEEIVREAWDSVLPGSSEAEFLDSVSSIMDRRLEEIV
ncbi:UNVERIFIED_CONTAM: Phosphatidylinositol 4-kinase gamma 4 [Sesamum calycinum]|uniref:1-phosphatidylinositol 4-kinase n=1 Tax=Sesamum calycinum TaxID=2727403 RepID=A0AAW2NV45_9LAMI